MQPITEDELSTAKNLVEEFSGFGYESGGLENIRAANDAVIADSVVPDRWRHADEQIAHTLLKVTGGFNSICAPIIAEYAAIAMSLLPRLIAQNEQLRLSAAEAREAATGARVEKAPIEAAKEAAP